MILVEDRLFYNDTASRERLATVHPALRETVFRLGEDFPRAYLVVEGRRTFERQKELVSQGKSKTLNSKHLRQKDGWSHAVDLVRVVDGIARWEDEFAIPMAQRMRDRFKNWSEWELVWGGDWRSFHDSPHFELVPRSAPEGMAL